MGVIVSCAIAACAPQATTDAGPDVVRDSSGGGDARADAMPTDTGDDVHAGDATPGADAADVADGGMDAAGDTVDVPIVPDAPDVATDVPVTPTCPFGVIGAIAFPSSTSGTLMGANDVTSTSCQDNANGPDDFYTLHLDAMTGVDLRTSGTLDTVLSIRTACDTASTEVACDDDHGPGTRSWVRTVLPPGDYFVIVDQYSTGTGGAYGLDAKTFTPAPNSSCAAPSVLTAGTPVTGNTDTGSDVPSRCITDGGQVLYYSLTVPAGNRATVTATPSDSTWSAALRVFDGCDATSCNANATSASDGAAASVSFDNRGTSDQTYLIAVGSTSMDTNGTFTLNAMVSPLPSSANAMCSMATALTPGMSVTQDSSTGVDPFNSACVSSGSGHVLYYTVNVPPQRILTVDVQPTGFDAVVQLLPSCGATTCLASADDGGSDSDEVVGYTNTGTTAQTVIVAVGSYSASSDGSFAVTATLSPIYTTTAITAMCDDMTSATVVSGVTTDDSASTIAPLPIAFTYFGTSATNYSVTSNGFLQLWTDTSGSPSTDYINEAIPSTSEPNAYIAPFWDDLRPPGSGSYDVRVLNVTTGTPHFTVQWTNWSFGSTSAARLTFQAQLYPGTNVIEMHYCNLTPEASGTRARGSDATIGIENWLGNGGTQFSNDTASVDTGTAIRFTPAP
jgi:hypothetical protein